MLLLQLLRCFPLAGWLECVVLWAVSIIKKRRNCWICIYCINHCIWYRWFIICIFVYFRNQIANKRKSYPKSIFINTSQKRKAPNNGKHLYGHRKIGFIGVRSAAYKMRFQLILCVLFNSVYLRIGEKAFNWANIIGFFHYILAQRDLFLFRVLNKHMFLSYVCNA